MPENTGNQLNGSESPKRRQWPEGKGTWTLTQKSEALDWGGGGARRCQREGRRWDRRLPAGREVESRFSRALSPGGSHVSSSPALPDGGRGRGASAESPWSGGPSGGGKGEAPARVGLSQELRPRRRRGEVGPPQRRFRAARLSPPRRLERKRQHAQPRAGSVAGRPHRPPVQLQAGSRAERSSPRPRDLPGLGPPQPGAPRSPTHRWRV